MRVLGIITARGGSKGIHRKNLVEIEGKSLLEYTAEVALKSEIDRVVLSTEDVEIMQRGRILGLDVPFSRPAELALDDTPTIPVLQDVVRRLAVCGDQFDAVFTLQPTSPLRLVSDIDGAIELLKSSGADSVISFVDVGEKHPARMKYIEASGKVIDPPFAEQFEGQRRQELPKMYLRDGSVYLTRTEVLMAESSLKGKDCRAWIIPQQRACNIDNELDLLILEQLIRYNRTK